MFTVAWGNAPGTRSIMCLAEGHSHPRPFETPEDPTVPQSLTKLYAHLIFSTKNRKLFLNDEIRPRVHAYMATVIRDLDAPFVVVGGVADHIHVLFDIGKDDSTGQIR
jgi:hypothetical protein